MSVPGSHLPLPIPPLPSTTLLSPAWIREGDPLDLFTHQNQTTHHWPIHGDCIFNFPVRNTNVRGGGLSVTRSKQEAERGFAQVMQLLRAKSGLTSEEPQELISPTTGTSPMSAPSPAAMGSCWLCPELPKVRLSHLPTDLVFLSGAEFRGVGLMNSSAVTKNAG